MNSVIEVLYLRRPRLEYVSPPICEFDFSSSGGPIISLETIGQLLAPSGFILSGRGRFVLSWTNYPGAICYTVYKAVDPNNPFGEYVVVAECIEDPSINLEPNGPGCYRVSAITEHGETQLSDPICGVGGCPFIESGATPAGQTVTVGDPVVISAVVGNEQAADFYHWYKDDLFYLDTTDTTQEVLNIASATLFDTGSYTLIVGNDECEDESGPSNLLVQSGSGAENPIAWWKMDGPATDPVDEVGAYVLSDQGNIPGVPAHTGKIVDSFRYNAVPNSVCSNSTVPPIPALAPTGNGAELLFWGRFNTVIAPGPNPPLVCFFQVGYFLQTGVDSNVLGLEYNPLTNPGNLRASFGAATVDIPFTHTIALWQFFRVRWDATTGKVGVSVDNAALTESVSTQFLAGTGTNGLISIATTASPFQQMDVSIDEFGVFDTVLTAFDVSFWYNGGAGRTYP